jgi:hypothetical protein
MPPLNMVGAGQHRPEENQGSDLLFIDHYSRTRRGFGRIVSHARRTQQTRKRKQQSDAAKQSAGYARSLVGWEQQITSRGNTTISITARVQIQKQDHHTAEDNEPADNHPSALETRQNVVDSSILTPVDTGLRRDPFRAFPTDNSRQAMHMVDFVSMLL